MKEWLVAVTEPAIVIIDALALLVIVIGTAEAVVRGLRMLLSGSPAGFDVRTLWLHYARWLVGALTFQLAADIIETAIAPDWETIAQLGAIAVIRTFLNFFLERDVAEIRERQVKTAEG